MYQQIGKNIINVNIKTLLWEGDTSLMIMIQYVGIKFTDKIFKVRKHCFVLEVWWITVLLFALLCNYCDVHVYDTCYCYSYDIPWYPGFHYKIVICTRKKFWFWLTCLFLLSVYASLYPMSVITGETFEYINRLN